MGGKGWRGKRKNRGKGSAAQEERQEQSDGEEDGGSARKQARKAEPARNDIWREAGSWELVNEAYEAYYQRQKICSEEEWPKLLQALRSGLPVAIRINRMRLGSPLLSKRLHEMKQICSGDEAREQFAPVRLSWFAHDLAWHWPGLERRTVKKNKQNAQLKTYLMNRERSGLISRQEVVSMIPPLFLSVEPHHMVLDLCAAPGSKTSQILEIMHWPQDAENSAPPQGLVLANELQWKRANMLAHQVQRLGSPCAAVVNMDAQFFPDLWEKVPGEESRPLRFDRILCDVPCSGDGTMRKTPYIWKSWTFRDGISLHIRQLGILYRGLDMLKVGGRLVYSTCSLNPVEDEAVIAAALHRHGDAVALLPPPDLDGLCAANGLERWVIQDPSGGAFYESYDDVPKELREGKCKLLASMFPPVGEGAAGIGSSVQKHCRRFLPHLMDTGGFFVAVLEKRAELRPSAKARREDKRVQIQASKAAQQQEGAAPGSAEKSSEGTKASDADGQSSAVVSGTGSENSQAMTNSVTQQTIASTSAPQGLKGITKEYVKLGEDMWIEIRDFYGLDPAVRSRMVQRNGSDQRVFLLSEGGERLLASEAKMPTRMVLCGVIALEKANSHHVLACQWRLAQQGVAAMNMVGLKRRLFASKEFLVRLLREKEVSLDEVREAATGGSVKGLEAFRCGAQGSNDLRPGSLAVVYDGKADAMGGSRWLAVAASMSDDMLELAVGSASETASLLEELEGQPEVEQILSAPVDDAADDEPEEDADAPADQDAPLASESVPEGHA